MAAASTYEDYDALLARDLGLHNTQALVSYDKAVLVGNLLAEGEFHYVPRRDYTQLQALHRHMMASPGFPRELTLLGSFVEYYHTYAPESGEFECSRVAAACSNLALLAPEDRQVVEDRTAALLVDASFSDSRVRRVLEDSPITAYRQVESTLSVDSVEVPLEDGPILELGTGVREAMRRVQELRYGVFPRVVQIGSRTFPSYVAHHMLLRTGSLQYERIAKDIAQGSDELVERHAKAGHPGFSAIIMAQSAEAPSFDQATQAIDNARHLCRDGGVFVIRDAISALYRGGYAFNDLMDAAQKHFGRPVDQQTLLQRRNVDNSVQLAIFKAS